jgi:hypothetical protein
VPSVSSPSADEDEDFPALPEDPSLIPTVPFEDVKSRMEDFWLPGQAPHHSIIAQTRGGKSYLIGEGILPLIEDEHVLIIDVKGDDPTFKEIGKPVNRIPRRGSRTFNDWLSEGKPREHWYRLIVSEDWTDARNQVGKALLDCYKEHNWTVVLDETRALTDPRIPSLNLGPIVEQMWLRGGSKGICVVAATQGPRWVPKSFYEQAQFHWIGRVEDEDSQNRLREIGGMERYHLPQIKTLPKHHFVYTDNQDDTRYRGITKC